MHGQQNIKIYNKIYRTWNVKTRCDTSNNRHKWNRLIMTETVPERHTGKTGNLGATENNHTGHYTLLEMLMYRYRTHLTWGNNITCSTDCKYTVYPRNMVLFGCVIVNGGNYSGEWKHLKTSQVIPKQHTVKTRN